MVIHHPNRLHVRIADGGAHEFEAAFLESLAHGVTLGRTGGNLFKGFESILYGYSIDEPPDEFRK